MLCDTHNMTGSQIHTIIQEVTQKHTTALEQVFYNLKQLIFNLLK